MAKKKRKGSSKAPRPQTDKYPKPVAPFDDHEWETNGRLCQTMVALGVGAGPIRITTGAALWMYARLWPFYLRQTDPAGKGDVRLRWFDPADCPPGGDQSKYRGEAAQVLDLARSVGRFAAARATAHGRFAIRVDDVKAGMKLFAKPAPKSGQGIRGAYCVD